MQLLSAGPYWVMSMVIASRDAVLATVGSASMAAVLVRPAGVGWVVASG